MIAVRRLLLRAKSLFGPVIAAMQHRE